MAGITTVECNYCGTIHEVAPGFETLTCRACNAPMRANFAYYPVGVPATRTATIAAVAEDWPIIGVDVSKWQGAMDWGKPDAPISFAYLRAGYGNAYFDERLAENVQGCKDNGIPFGLYWFVTPDKSFEKHADNFAIAYKQHGGALPPVLDAEVTGGLGKTALAGWLEKFTNRFEQATGKQLAIYTSPGWWNTNMPLTNWAKNRKLWVAHWTTAAQPTLPNEWTAINQPRTWTFWQYTAKGDGALYGAQSKSIDLNRFNGDREAFKAAFGVYPHEAGVPVPPPPPPPPVEPPPAELPEYMTVTAGKLNMRHAPVVKTDNIFAVLPYGTRVKVEERDGDWVKLSAWVSKNYLK